MTRVWAVYFAYFSASLLASLLLTPVARQIAFRVKAVDRGTGRRVHEGIVPRLGGVAIFLAFAAPLVFSLTRGSFDAFHWRLTGILMASALVFAIGVLDDLRRASIWTRLLVEAGGAVIVFFWGVRITALSNPFGGTIELGWLSLPVTLLWIVVITNAINLIDGLDGLAAGTGILIAGTLLIIGFPRDLHVNLVFVMLIGSLAGFLAYNFPPASIFMGDSGSLFLGFFLASFTIVSSSKAQALATMMIPLIAFSLPLMDMSYAVLRRYYRGIPLGKPDREHIHHKLLERGLGKKKTVLILYLLNGGLMAFILVFVSANVDLNYLFILALFLLAVGGLRFLGYLQFRTFFRASLRNIRISRKRRYVSYLLRRFRNDHSDCRHPGTLRIALHGLLTEYGVQRARIRVPEGDPIVLFERPDGEPAASMELRFPVKMGCGDPCEVTLVKEIDEDGFLCSADLVHALREAIARIYSPQDGGGRGG